MKCFASIKSLLTGILAVAFLPAQCLAQNKRLMDHVENTTQDGIYSLFNLIFSSYGTWVLLGLAAFVVFLFNRRT